MIQDCQRVEVLARSILRHPVSALVGTLAARVGRALIEIVATPIQAHAQTEEADVIRAERPVLAIALVQTELRRTACGSEREESQSQPEKDQIAPRG